LSTIKGDKARANRLRRKRIHNRQRARTLRAQLGTGHAPQTAATPKRADTTEGGKAE